MLPQAPGDPAARRAPRDLLRRRMPLRRTRTALLAHRPKTTSQDPRPARGPKRADQANRGGVAARVLDPAVPTSLAGHLALSGHADRLRALPGVGKIRAWGLRDALHARQRLPRGQAGLAAGRLGTGAQAAAGTCDGPSGPKLGQAALPWAFCAAAVLVRRQTPPGQHSRARLVNNPGPGNALPV
jgi:hypothetical protein